VVFIEAFFYNHLMRILIDNRHREYFKTQGYISFNAFFSQEKLSQIREVIQQGTKGGDQLEDLLRNNPLLKKLIDLKTLGYMTRELTEEKPVRFGFDRLVNEAQTQTLKEISSIQGILLGLFIDLSSGDITCFSKEIPFPKELKNGYLIVLTGKDPVYIHNQNDPYAHQLKKLGYSFGDRLREATHETLSR
jgi:hypothetical protein